MSNPIAVLRLHDLVSRTGLSRSSIYKMMGESRFPKSFSLSPRCIGWLESDISTWIEMRVTESRRVTSEHRKAALRPAA